MLHTSLTVCNLLNARPRNGGRTLKISAAAGVGSEQKQASAVLRGSQRGPRATRGPEGAQQKCHFSYLRIFRGPQTDLGSQAASGVVSTCMDDQHRFLLILCAASLASSNL